MSLERPEFTKKTMKRNPVIVRWQLDGDVKDNCILVNRTAEIFVFDVPPFLAGLATNPKLLNVTVEYPEGT